MLKDIGVLWQDHYCFCLERTWLIFNKSAPYFSVIIKKPTDKSNALYCHWLVLIIITFEPEMH